MSPAWPLGRRDPDEVEVGGTWLAADAQRSPINTEAKLLLLTHAFDVWDVRRVAICTDARNERSRRAIERLGATFEGVLRQHRASTAAGEAGTLRDTAVYAIVAADWPAVRDRLSARAAERRRRSTTADRRDNGSGRHGARPSTSTSMTISAGDADVHVSFRLAAGIGLAAGLLGGLFGVGGGLIIVPSLLAFANMDRRRPTARRSDRRS